MTNQHIAHRRLHNQFISRQRFERPEEVVQWLGAVQSQDYAAAKWALGLRLRGATDDAIEQAFASGAILRTHIMRPTWHFVSPADIRWMLMLTAPRIHTASSYYYRSLELDDAVFTKSSAVLVEALQGGTQLTRTELASALSQAGIACENLLRLNYIIIHTELDGIICSGARRGKQFTYALLDERVPQSRTLDRDEALAEFAHRYFTSHGPATLQDFAWWSGLTATDARAALEMASSQLVREVIDEQTYWSSGSAMLENHQSQTMHLLPNFDEYIVAYTDRSAVFDDAHTEKLDPRGNVLFNHTIVLHGRVVGTWKRTLKKDSVIITPTLFTPLNDAESRALAAAADRYGAFLGLSVEIVGLMNTNLQER